MLYPRRVSRENVQRPLNKLNINSLIKAPTNGGRNRQGAPTFPGANTGASVEAIRKLIGEQPRNNGFKFVVGAGTPTNIPNIALPGDSRVFLGLIFTPSSGAVDQFTLEINGLKIVTNGSIVLHSQSNSASIKNGYFPYPQPLTGKDEIVISVNSVAGFTGIVELHYI